MELCSYLEKYKKDVLEHAKHVEFLSLRLFEQLNLNLNSKLPPRLPPKLLSYGALLHDIGMSEGNLAHNKIGAKMVLEHGIEGLDDEETLIVACLVRYHRGANPKEIHKNFSKLNIQSQKTVKIFSSIIRLADALDWKHKNFTEDVEIKIDNKKVFLTLHGNSNIIIKTGFLKFFTKKKDLFEKVFGVSLCICPN